MAILTGNIVGDPSGTLGNVVFGKARTRTGKVVTMRRWARPTNPNTAAQINQRAQFADAVQIVRALGPGFYQTDWNRAVGQLPGYHGLMNIMILDLDESFQFTDPPDTPLGTLHVPDTRAVLQGAVAGEIDFTWSAELGENGAAADDVICFAIAADRDVNDEHSVYIMTPELTRATSPGTLDTGETATDFVCGFYLRSTLGEPAGLSTCKWNPITTGA